MPKATPLSRERILVAAEKLLVQGGPQNLTLRKLGDQLGVNNTALYRHFRNKDELLKILNDRLLADVVPADDPDGLGDWRTAIRTICLRLRAAHMAQPQLSGLAQTGPRRDPNELRITETIFAHLAAAGFEPEAAARIYLSVIELTLGAAALDAPMARLGEEQREVLYSEWRRDYAAMDPERFPYIPRHSEYMYLGDATSRFEDALDAMLDGFQLRYHVA